MTVDSVVVRADGRVAAHALGDRHAWPPGGSQLVSASTKFTSPHLWNGSPTRISTRRTREIRVGGAVTDLVTAPLGFRYFASTPRRASR